MEKIIAVVVMIAIVIGLIATAVMPYVSQINNQGQDASSQMNLISGAITGESLSGATVKADIAANWSRLLSKSEPIVSITVNGYNTTGVATKKIAAYNSATSTFVTGSDNVSTLAGIYEAIQDGHMFTVTTEKYPDGKVKTYTYNVVAMN